MDLENRIRLLVELGDFIESADPAWTAAKTRTFHHNSWFIPEFIDLAIKNINRNFLRQDLLDSWADKYEVSDTPSDQQVGLVMAGNIPLVGFHDFLCCFISGYKIRIKLSSKDPFLFPEILNFLKRQSPDLDVQTAPMLKGMDAYIATGSNNSARYFEYYFGKYPSLIRRNRTSIAVLDGTESTEELGKLADDVFTYFGLGCRSVTQILVPEKYDFVPLLTVFRKYHWMSDHHKYKNNYDYRLSLAILNKQYYMSNESVLLIEDDSPFSPISVLHYRQYKNQDSIFMGNESEILQDVIGKNFVPFGNSQQPGLENYADGEDTMAFLQNH